MVISGEHRKRLRESRRILWKTDRAWGFARRKDEEYNADYRDGKYGADDAARLGRQPLKEWGVELDGQGKIHAEMKAKLKLITGGKTGDYSKQDIEIAAQLVAHDHDRQPTGSVNWQAAGQQAGYVKGVDINNLLNPKQANGPQWELGYVPGTTVRMLGLGLPGVTPSFNSTPDWRSTTHTFEYSYAGGYCDANGIYTPVPIDDTNQRLLAASGRMLFATLEMGGGLSLLAGGGAGTATGVGAAPGVGAMILGYGLTAHGFLEFTAAFAEFNSALVHERKIGTPLQEMAGAFYGLDSVEARYAGYADQGISLLGGVRGVAKVSTYLGAEVTMTGLWGSTLMAGTAGASGQYITGGDPVSGFFDTARFGAVMGPVGSFNKAPVAALALAGGFLNGSYDAANQYVSYGQIDANRVGLSFLLGTVSAGGGAGLYRYFKSRPLPSPELFHYTRLSDSLQYTMSGGITDLSLWGPSVGVGVYYDLNKRK